MDCIELEISTLYIVSSMVHVSDSIVELTAIPCQPESNMPPIIPL